MPNRDTPELDLNSGRFRPQFQEVTTDSGPSLDEVIHEVRAPIGAFRSFAPISCGAQPLMYWRRPQRRSGPSWLLLDGASIAQIAVSDNRTPGEAC